MDDRAAERLSLWRVVHRLDEFDRGAELRPPVAALAMQPFLVEEIHVLNRRKKTRRVCLWGRRILRKGKMFGGKNGYCLSNKSSNRFHEELAPWLPKTNKKFLKKVWLIRLKSGRTSYQYCACMHECMCQRFVSVVMCGAKNTRRPLEGGEERSWKNESEK